MHLKMGGSIFKHVTTIFIYIFFQKILLRECKKVEQLLYKLFPPPPLFFMNIKQVALAGGTYKEGWAKGGKL